MSKEPTNLSYEETSRGQENRSNQSFSTPYLNGVSSVLRVMQEETLLVKARQLDAAALTEVYDQFSPGIYRYAYRLTGDAERAEECVADTFLRFLTALQNQRGPHAYLKAYLYRTAHNWIVDQARRFAPGELDQENDVWDETQPNPADVALTRIEHERARRAILHLTPDQQQVIMLKYMENWENEEIARTMNKPVGAVKALQSRGLASLQRIMQKEEKER